MNGPRSPHTFRGGNGDRSRAARMEPAQGTPRSERTRGAYGDTQTPWRWASPSAGPWTTSAGPDRQALTSDPAARGQWGDPGHQMAGSVRTKHKKAPGEDRGFLLSPTPRGRSSDGMEHGTRLALGSAGPCACSSGWGFATPEESVWRHCPATVCARGVPGLNSPRLVKTLRCAAMVCPRRSGNSWA